MPEQPFPTARTIQTDPMQIASPLERQQRTSAFDTQPNLMQQLEPRQRRRGFGESLQGVMLSDAILPQIIRHALEPVVTPHDNSYDPDFNPIDEAEALEGVYGKQMVDELLSVGSPALLAPNQEALHFYFARQAEQQKFRDASAEAGLPTQLLGAVIADGPFAAAKAVRVGGAALQRFAAAGKTAGSRAARYGAIGATAGAGYELMLDKLDPERDGELRDRLLGAGVVGAGFTVGLGVALPLLGQGLGKAFSGPAGSLHRKLGNVRDKIVESQLHDELASAKGVIDADTRMLDHHLSKVETPTENRTLDIAITKETRPLIAKLTERYEKAGLKLEVQPTNQRLIASALESIDDLDAMLQKHRQKFEGLTGGIAAALGRWLPGRRLHDSASESARVFSDTMFNDRVAKNTEARPNNAEYLQQNMQIARIRANSAVNQSLRGHFEKGGEPFQMTTSDGETITISGIRDAVAFQQAVGDAMRTKAHNRRMGIEDTEPMPGPAAEAAEATQRFFSDYFDRLELAGLLEGRRALEIRTRELAELKAQLPAKSAGQPASHGPQPPSKLERQIADAEDRLEDLANKVDFAEDFISQQWHAARVAQKPKTFKNRMLAHIAGHDGFNVDGTPRDMSSPLHPAIIANMPDAFKAIAEDAGSYRTLRTADNNAAELYKEKVRQDLARRVDEIYDAITKSERPALENTEAIFPGGGPLNARVLRDLDPAEFREFFENDVSQLMHTYDQQLSGHVAVRQSIKDNESLLAPIVEANLGEDFNGTPQQLLKAIEREFDDMAEAAALVDKAAGSNIAKKVDNARKSTHDALTEKLAELLGGSRVASLGTESERNLTALGRVALRFPVLARMGGAMASSFSDAASIIAATMVGRKRSRMIAEMMAATKGSERGLNNMPRYAIEGTYSAVSDAQSQRALQFGQVVDADPALDTMLGKLDRVSDASTRKLMKWSLMNWWNSGAKAMAASVVQQEFVQGALKLRRAQKMMAKTSKNQNPKSREEALKAVGLTEADTERLKQLGVDSKRADAFTQEMHRHGLDINGDRIADKMTLTEFMEYDGFVAPNFEQWGTRMREPRGAKTADNLRVLHMRQDQARRLSNSWKQAVDSEVRGMIVEPDLGSRPLMNKWWLGKAVNQFWAFTYSYSNQALPRLAQHNSGQQAIHFSNMVMLGGLSEALKNHIAGRESLEDTAQLWRDNPQAAIHAAMQRSGMFGTMDRVTQLTDLGGVSLGGMLGSDGSSRHFSRAEGVIGTAAPIADYAMSVADGFLSPLAGRRTPTPGEFHKARSTIWFQNLLPLTAAHRMAVDSDLIDPVLTPE